MGAGYEASRRTAALRDLPFVNVVGICDVDRKKRRISPVDSR